MPPALLIAAAWALFTGTHLILSSSRLRPRLVARFGERDFVNVFSAVAAVTFTILIASAALLRDQGAAGPALGSQPAIRTAAIAAITLGFALSAASLASYGRSPMALFSSRVREPRGIERVTRHALFAGLTLIFLAHIPLAPTLSAATFFAGFVFHSVLGAWLQDRKLAARLGAPYREYMAATSSVPFAAVLTGRQRMALGEQRWTALALGVATAWGVRMIHTHLFDYIGIGIVAVVLAGAALATAGAERAARARTEAA